MEILFGERKGNVLCGNFEYKSDVSIFFRIEENKENESTIVIYVPYKAIVRNNSGSVYAKVYRHTLNHGIDYIIENREILSQIKEDKIKHSFLDRVIYKLEKDGNYYNPIHADVLCEKYGIMRNELNAITEELLVRNLNNTSIKKVQF